MPGRRLYAGDQQLAAGAEEVQVLAAEIKCSVQEHHTQDDTEAHEGQ